MSRISNLTRNILANAVSLHKWALLHKLAKAKQELDVIRSAHSALCVAVVSSAQNKADAVSAFEALKADTDSELAGL